MTVGIVDSTVIIHLYRKYSPAINWAKSLTTQLGITTISWLEVVVGAPSKAGLATSKVIMNQFNLVHLTTSDQDWAIQQLEKYRLSHGIGLNDCLIASIAFRLQVPIYTHNLKHMELLLGKNLVIKPYV
ncbi:MAG: PIN domain-containing protein [Anaerolineae bacterium]|nr:PIN domain-containing protein [Anaerolineae bacterium]